MSADPNKKATDSNDSKPTDKIAGYLLAGSFIIIIALISYYIFNTEDPESERPKDLFNLVWPILTSWVGTILAYYFGKENFEAASKSYKEIINTITPEVLDDASVKQVMTDRDSIVALTVEEITNGRYDVPKLIEFLNLVKKSRLPILKDDKVVYIIHKSLLTEEVALKPASNPELTFEGFVANHKAVIEKFGKVNESDKIEAAQKLVKEQNQSDIIVTDKEGKMVGWLTSVQIARYLTC